MSSNPVIELVEQLAEDAAAAHARGRSSMSIELGDVAALGMAAAVLSEAGEALDRVRRLHPLADEEAGSLLAPGKWCPGCGEERPCRTRRVIRGDGS
jgi:hypothetical protein